MVRGLPLTMYAVVFKFKSEKQWQFLKIANTTLFERKEDAEYICEHFDSVALPEEELQKKVVKLKVELAGEEMVS